MNILDAYIRIIAKDEASNEIDAVSENVIGKLVGAAKTAAKALAGMWVTKKVYEFGRAAFDAYSSFEQLAGGAAKIFSELDQTEILNDANNAFINLNMSANEYLQSINTVGATFAQTMGQKKGYETAKKGMQAISDFATGTGASISLLNEKYKLITRSASGYQSIADQFAGILPQTSKDFLEQAQAAGFLESKYKSLTDVPVAEYQEAVTAMIEKGVEAQGLLGNTAAEALNTLEGSALAAKSAWQNLITEFGKPDADIGARIRDMMTALLGKDGKGGLVRNVAGEARVIASNVINAISSALGQGVDWLVSNGPSIALKAVRGVIDAMGQAATSLGTFDLSELFADMDGSGIGERISTMIGNISEIIREWSPDIAEAASNLLSSVGDFIANNGPILLERLGGILNDVAQWVIANAPTIIASAYEAWLTLLEWVTSHGPELVDKVAEVIGNVITTARDWLIENGPSILEAILQIVQSVIQLLMEHGPEILGNIAETIGTIVAYILSASVDMLNAAIQFMGGLITGTSQEGEALREWFANLPQMLLDALGDLGSFLIDAGTQIMQGFWDGLTSKFSEIQDWVSGIGDWIASHKGPRQYDLGLLVQNGQWIMSGLQEGLEKGLPPVEDTLRDITDTIQTGINTNVLAAKAPTQTDAALMGMLGAIRDNMNMSVYLDGKTLVGGIAPQMNVAMGRL